MLSTTTEQDSDDSIYKYRRKSRRQRVSSLSSDSDDSVVARPHRRKKCRVSSSSSDSDDSMFARPSRKKCKILSESESGSTETSDSEEERNLRRRHGGRPRRPTVPSDCEAPSEKGSPTTKETSTAIAEINSSDSDEGEKCIICFKSLKPPFAYPSNCSHHFHPNCLATWTKTSNTCPIDRVKYTAIVVVDNKGDVVSREGVSTPPPQDHNADFELDDATFCEVCTQHDREHEMLLCDRCEAGYHLDCLTPPLHEVPEGSWFCPRCTDFGNELEQEMNELMDDAAIILETRMRQRPPTNARIPSRPRTRGAQRVFNIIHHQQSTDQPSTSSVTIRRRRTNSRRTRRSKSTRRSQSTRYKVELITVEDGTTLEVKVAVNTRTKSSKRRSKRKSKKCSRNSHKGEGPSTSRDTIFTGEGPSRPLDLFGSRPQLEYFSGCEAEDELDDDGRGGVSAICRGARPEVRNMASRKQIAAQILNSRPRRPAPRIEVSRAPVDLVSSIIEQQEKWHSPGATYESSSNGNIRVIMKEKASKVRMAGGSSGGGSSGTSASSSTSSGRTSQAGPSRTNSSQIPSSSSRRDEVSGTSSSSETTRATTSDGADRLADVDENEESSHREEMMSEDPPRPIEKEEEERDDVKLEECSAEGIKCKIKEIAGNQSKSDEMQPIDECSSSVDSHMDQTVAKDLSTKKFLRDSNSVVGNLLAKPEEGDMEACSEAGIEERELARKDEESVTKDAPAKPAPEIIPENVDVEADDEDSGSEQDAYNRSENPKLEEEDCENIHPSLEVSEESNNGSCTEVALNLVKVDRAGMAGGNIVDHGVDKTPSSHDDVMINNDLKHVDESEEHEESKTPGDESVELEESKTPKDESGEREEFKTPVDECGELEESEKPVDESNELEESRTPVNVRELEESRTPVDKSGDIMESKTAVDESGELEESETPVDESNELEESRTPVNVSRELEESRTPVNKSGDIMESKTAVDESGELEESKTPVDESNELEESRTPVNESGELEESRTPVDKSGDIMESKTAVDESGELEESKTPVDESNELEESRAPVNESGELEESRTPVDKSGDLMESISPVDESGELEESKTPVDESEELEESKTNYDKDGESDGEVEGGHAIAAVSNDTSVIECTGHNEDDMTSQPVVVSLKSTCQHEFLEDGGNSKANESRSEESSVNNDETANSDLNDQAFVPGGVCKSSSATENDEVSEEGTTLGFGVPPKMTPEDSPRGYPNDGLPRSSDSNADDAAQRTTSDDILGGNSDDESVSSKADSTKSEQGDICNTSDDTQDLDIQTKEGYEPERQLQSGSGGELLASGCQDEKDGLVDITDEEISNYERSWEIEKTFEAKKNGLGGLDTEAISDCEYHPMGSELSQKEGDIDQVTQVVREDVEEISREEEGEIVNEGVSASSKKKLSADRKFRDLNSKEKNKGFAKNDKSADNRRVVTEKLLKNRDERRIVSSSSSTSSSCSTSLSASIERSISREKMSRNRSRSRSRARIRGRLRDRVRDRSRSREHLKDRSVSKEKTRKNRSRDEKSRSRSRKRRRTRSPRRERLQSKGSRDRKRRRSPSSSCSSCSCSSCERGKKRNEKLTVIVPRDGKGRDQSRNRGKTKKDKRRSRSRNRKRKTPVPSKEVFTSGNNILVSVNFKSSNAEGSERAECSLPSKRKKDEEVRKKKEKRTKESQPMRSAVSKKTKQVKKKLNTSNIKPIAIIDLDASPFRETTLSPKEVIILTDSDDEGNTTKAVSSVLVSGPKTPPEPHIKFSIANSMKQQQQLRGMQNPLVDKPGREDNDVMHIGPNTPPEPSAAYDPFEPTRSRSQSPTTTSRADGAPTPSLDTKRYSPLQSQASLTPPKLSQHESPKTPSPLHNVPSDLDNLQEKKKQQSALDSGDNSPGGGGDSPYSPGSSEGDDLFEPPMAQTSAVPKSRQRSMALQSSKPKTLPPKVAVTSQKHSINLAKDTSNKGQTKKEFGLKLDEDQLKILDDLPNSAVEMQVKDKFLKKLNRQERVVEEVKLVLKPHYAKKHVTKEEYKEILRRSVPKICHSRSGEINPMKIQRLIEAYVKKYRHKVKKKAPTIPPLRQNKPMVIKTQRA